MNAEQKQRAADLLTAWRATTYALHADSMAALLQELVDAPETEPVARVTGYYAGYLSIATVDGRVLPTGTALYTAPPAPSVPDMPLSMEQFGGLVGLARDDASEKAIVYKATNIYGETCYFGVKSTAQVWAKSGSVEGVRLRDLRVLATPAPQLPKLSDERIFDLLKQVDPHAVRLPLGFKQFARAIEREILGGEYE